MAYSFLAFTRDLLTGCDRLRTLHMAALARHWPYIQLTSSASFQSSPEMVSPREGNKVGRDSTDGSVFTPSGIDFTAWFNMTLVQDSAFKWSSDPGDINFPSMRNDELRRRLTPTSGLGMLPQ